MTADFNPRFVKDQLRAVKDQLRAFVERVQRLEEDIKTINDDKRDVYAEAKGNGFDVPALKAVVAYLRKDRDEAEERRAIFDLYLDNVVGTEHATRAPARLPPPTKKSPSVAQASLSDGAARSVSPTPERAAESQANAREEARALENPAREARQADLGCFTGNAAEKSQSIAERASRLATGRTVAPGRDGITPAPIPESVMSTDGAACTVIPPPRPPVQAATDLPIENGGSCICEFAPDTDVCIHCGTKRTEWCPRTTSFDDDLDITKQPWKAGLDALKASA